MLPLVDKVDFIDKTGNKWQISPSSMWIASFAPVRKLPLMLLLVGEVNLADKVGMLVGHNTSLARVLNVSWLEKTQ